MPGQFDEQPCAPRQNCAVAGHALPQLPQFSGSDTTFVQPVPHCVKPTPQPHTPFEHCWPCAQARPQAPQFRGSVATLAHTAPHSAWVGGQLTPPVPPLPPVVPSPSSSLSDGGGV